MKIPKRDRAPTRSLASFAASVNYDSLETSVKHQAKRCLLDTLAAIIGGVREKIPLILADEFCEVGAGKSQRATVILSKMKTTAASAALINSAMAHSLEFDDGHRFAAGHPGSVVIPAALAVGEMNDSSGEELISSIVAGYEIFIRIGSSINPSHLRRGFHTTGTCGPFGATAAAGRILRLNPSQMEDAFGLAGLQGAGLLRVVESGAETKPIQVAKASQSGVLASLFVNQGLNGPRDILEGSMGFLGVMTDKFDNLKLIENLGDTYRIGETYVSSIPHADIPMRQSRAH